MLRFGKRKAWISRTYQRWRETGEWCCSLPEVECLEVLATWGRTFAVCCPTLAQLERELTLFKMMMDNFLVSQYRHGLVYIRLLNHKWHTAHVYNQSTGFIRNTAHRPNMQASYMKGSGTTMQENQPAAQIAAKHNIISQMVAPWLYCFVVLLSLVIQWRDHWPSGHDSGPFGEGENYLNSFKLWYSVMIHIFCFCLLGMIGNWMCECVGSEGCVHVWVVFRICRLC